MSFWPFSSSSSSPPDPPAPAASCPVDHSKFASSSSAPSSSIPTSPHPSLKLHEITPEELSKERVISSIPRWLPPAASSSVSPSSSDAEIPSACPAHSSPKGKEKEGGERWVYPSPSSFYTALERKNRSPSARDMDIVVPIHNAVNERVWDKVLEWERGYGEGVKGTKGEDGEVKLVSFVGKPKELSPRARWFSLIGYSPPFDRHDWIIDRPSPSLSSLSPSPTSPSSPTSTSPSTRVRYIIDFYTGRGALGSSHPFLGAGTGGGNSKGEGMPNLAFYIDVRPALDSWEGWRMRGERWWNENFGGKEEGRK